MTTWYLKCCILVILSVHDLCTIFARTENILLFIWGHTVDPLYGVCCANVHTIILCCAFYAHIAYAHIMRGLTYQCSCNINLWLFILKMATHIDSKYRAEICFAIITPYALFSKTKEKTKGHLFWCFITAQSKVLFKMIGRKNIHVIQPNTSYEWFAWFHLFQQYLKKWDNCVKDVVGLNLRRHIITGINSTLPSHGYITIKFITGCNTYNGQSRLQPSLKYTHNRRTLLQYAAE